MTVSDLKNYNEVKKMQDWRTSVFDEKGWLSLDELKALVGE